MSDWQQNQASRLLAMVAHDLRTPLAVIQGYCHLLELELTPEASVESRDYLATINSHTKLLGRLIESVILIDQVQRKSLKITPKRLDFQEIVAAVIDEVGCQADEKNVTVRLNKSKHPVWVEVDEPHLINSLYMVLYHGIQRCLPQQELHVLVGSPGSRVHLEVFDARAAMPELALDRWLTIPDPDSGDMNTSQPVFHIGLLAAGYVVAAHGGGLEAFRAENGGEKLFLYLPRSPE
jgi:K+-sensing histidine kinase KdpD